MTKFTLSRCLRKRLTGTSVSFVIVVLVWLAMVGVVVEKYYEDPHHAKATLAGPGPAGFAPEKVFADKVAMFRRDVGSLHNNMVAQCVFVVFGFFALTGRSKDFELPVLRLKLPVSWVHYLVPFCLFFLWLQFGFLLDEIINTRSDGVKILASLGPMSDDWRKLVCGQLNDSAFSDAWFLLFRRDETSISGVDTKTVAGLFSLVFGLLLGLTHAMIPGMLLYANACYTSQISRLSRGLRICVALVPWLSLVLLLLSHRQFYAGGDNPNWFQAVIASFAALGTLVIQSIPIARLAKAPERPSSLKAGKGATIRIRTAADGELNCEIIAASTTEESDGRANGT